MTPFQKILQKETHGTKACYRTGCRCEKCTEGNRIDSIKYRTNNRIKYNNYMKNWQRVNRSPKSLND